MAEDEAPVIQYSVKELFARIEDQLKLVLIKLDLKVDKADFDPVHQKVNEHEDRIKNLERSEEDQETDRSTAKTNKRWLVGLVFGVLTNTIIAVFTWLHSLPTPN